MAKFYVRDGERVRCPYDPDTRRELAVYALESREKIREFRLQMAWFEDHPEGAPPAEARAGALKVYAAGLRASYLELRRKMEDFDIDFFGRLERHLGRLAAGDRSAVLLPPAARSSRSRARPPWAKRGRRR